MGHRPIMPTGLMSPVVWVLTTGTSSFPGGMESVVQCCAAERKTVGLKEGGGPCCRLSTQSRWKWLGCSHHWHILGRGARVDWCCSSACLRRQSRYLGPQLLQFFAVLGLSHQDLLCSHLHISILAHPAQSLSGCLMEGDVIMLPGVATNVATEGWGSAARR